MIIWTNKAMFALLVILLYGCSFAPKYQRPPMPIPTQYKETGKWVSTEPYLVTVTANQPWWALFHDHTLTALEQKVTCDNNNLKIAVARYQEARAIADVTRSAMYPTIQGIGTIAKQKNSATFVSTSNAPLLYSTFLFTSYLNYEVDAWGRVKNSVIASDSLSRASAFDLAAIDLSLHAELASDYYSLRGYDEAQHVLDKTVQAYEKALYLTRQRHLGGMVAVAEVDEAISRVENAKTAAADNKLKRAQLEHAIAILIGEIPANFHLGPKKSAFHYPTVSPDLPSTLLLQRPDISAAAQRVRAANAQIGVARAAFFPAFNLIGLLGLESSQISKLFSSQSLFWSLGPSTALTLIQPEISQVIFDGFKLQALLYKAKASYYESVNAYKETVLTAFREVEDQLVAIHRLNQEKETSAKATIAAIRALSQANQQYRGGLVTYLDVVIYEDAALQSELSLISIKTRRQLASVQLMKALGGGWQEPG